MKLFALNFIVAVLSGVYAPMKLLPQKDKKVVFLSRQSNKPSMDFVMLQDELLKVNNGLIIVSICNRVESGLKSKALFAKDLLRSLYHLATARVCVLDSYWPTVSVLSHRNGLTVVQIWHALGKIKQSGLQAIGRAGGRDEGIARALRMHENYDFIVAGAKAWNPYYCASFGCREEQLVNIGLPRLDYLTHGDAEKTAEIYSKYPSLREKTVVLFAPTFRRTSAPDHSELVASLLSAGYALILKSHPNQSLDNHGAFICPEYSAMELLLVADYLITDFSAIALEAAAADVKTLYYLHDHLRYQKNTGVNIDLEEEMPGCVFYDPPSLVDGLKSAVDGYYPHEAFRRYQEKYLIPDRGHSTEDLTSLVLSHI